MSSRCDDHHPRSRLLRCLLAATACLIGAHALAGPVSCGSSAPLLALDPAHSFAELADLSLACSGGAATDPPLTFTLQTFFNTAVLTSVTPMLSVDGTSYAAEFTSPNSFRFTDVTINPVAALLEISEIFIDATLLPPSTGPIPTQVVTFISLVGSGTPALSNPQQILGTLSPAPTPVSEPVSSWLFWLSVFAVSCALLRTRGGSRRASVHTRSRIAMIE